jgi:RNA polymerase sigma-70 factor (ECF subfamily)
MDSELAEAFAEEWPRVVGATLRAFGSLDLAEEAAQEAFVRAAERLAVGDRIGNIGAWATTTAHRIAIDTLRRDRALRTKLPMLAVEEEQQEELGPADDRLGLIFVACDPVLSAEQQIALALRIVCGVPTADIADFFGIPEPTVAARLTRAKKAIARAESHFVWPSARHRETRLDEALTTIYGVYTLGHTAAAGDELMDARLAELAHTLATALVSEHPRNTEVLGLLAIIELGEARSGARTTEDGMPLTLAEVDRSAWGRQRMRDGLALAARALPGGGRFALQAGIAGLHCSAASWEDTDWNAIATLYYGLNRVWPAPIVKLGGIIARSHLGAVELDRAAEELLALRVRAPAEMRRRVSAALGDVEERRGNVEQAVAAFADAADGENNRALVRFYNRAIGRLLT